MIPINRENLLVNTVSRRGIRHGAVSHKPVRLLHTYPFLRRYSRRSTFLGPIRNSVARLCSRRFPLRHEMRKNVRLPHEIFKSLGAVRQGFRIVDSLILSSLFFDLKVNEVDDREKSKAVIERK